MAESSTDRTLDLNKAQCIHQLGGIQTGSIDHPQPAGGQSCRLAMFNTGSGLSFTVALDRGGDIVEASFNGMSLAFLTPNGYTPPSHAYHVGREWLAAWPGGLLTTCGPLHIGAPTGDDPDGSLHGHFSNTPAAIETIENPNAIARRKTMRLSMIIRCVRMFGPSVEIRRTITCTLGRPEIQLDDQVTNVGNTAVPHHWLYHINLGYPLLDEGARLIYGGTYDSGWDRSAGEEQLRERVSTERGFAAYKQVPAPQREHRGSGEHGMIIVPTAKRGQVTCGLINRKRSLGIAISYPAAQLPRLANWQHLGPRGSYVMGIEPFAGSLQWTADDRHPAAKLSLKPGQSRDYQLTLRICHSKAQLDALAAHDASLTVK